MQISNGDVVQINENFHQQGWIGAFVTVTDVKNFGVQGYVHHIVDKDNSGKAFIRIDNNCFDYIGKAVLVSE